jgi:histidine ammonia-lyase
MSDPAHSKAVVLDGRSLGVEDLVRIARDPRIRVEIADAAMERVLLSRRQIEEIVRKYRKDFTKGKAVLDYGITTGFGEFKNIPIPPEQLEELQCNILLSHAVGVGETADDLHPSNFFEPEVVRAALVIRLNAFLKGHSGIRQEMVRVVQAMINRGVVPLVPIRGSVGSSGDLCPLSHLFVVLLGHGRYFLVREPDDLLFKTRDVRSGLDSLKEDLGIDVPKPSFKEGLALTNGATFTAALLALAVHDSEHLARVADVALSLSLEAVCGCARAFDSRIHEVRGHPGQIASAAYICEQLKGSSLIESAGAVQDVYSLRCGPTVHGAARDTIAYARKAVEAEMNAATDNPLFFPADDQSPFDFEFRKNWPKGYLGDQRISFSAGNFHGEPVGFAADFLAIGLAELANISERRIQMLLDANHNRNLPSNLIPHRGVNSGWMIAQYTAAGIVSENKILTHPASVDSIPTSANAEDHNAMGIIAARKLRTVLRNAQAVLSIELLAAAQGVEWRIGMKLDPRGAQKSLDWKKADAEAKRFRKVVAPKRRPAIAAKLGEGTGRVYLKIRELTPPMLADDRTLDTDIRVVRAAVERNELV